ncbi:hypothetical protein [Aliikangiella coralliicola]|uniref:Porin n=1 Tax=Aliikangiella coralliicola TaxID=2592383 RepID=A0A545UJT0_9GAMM|nr:hypothetical protein [Aliikangiella coralliicola]TQV89727.1 hypothetical protein FLL46_02275 [Aliikangiella coralliicola]
MNQKLILSAVSCLTAGFFNSAAANEFEVRGNIELQGRFFVEDALFPTQHDTYFSLAAAPEFFWSWNDGNDSFEFVPSARIDQHDDERTHSDIRELSWIHVGDDWESRIGVRRVFWGVTEFQHLVDIINQSDSVEDVDNEDKLGQPMVNLSLVNDWGIIDFYVLPYFRERTFAGDEGRPGLPIINADTAFYESSDEEDHVDWAVRWAHSIGDYEIGVSWFEGTSRDPLLIQSPLQNVVPELVPFYQQISQLGFELQANIEDALWKLEIIHNDNNREDFWALQGGIEYSQYGVMDSNADLGWLVEIAWDERGDDGPSTFQNDVFFGSRLALNDVDSTEVLAGLSYDLDFKSTSFLVEASRRFGDSLKVSLDVRLFESDEPQDPAYLIRRDDHIQLTAQYYY